jgi:hypothetical protein
LLNVFEEAMNLRKLSVISIVIAAAALVSMRSDAAAEPGRLEGIVTDPNGAEINGAFILVHWDPAGSTTGLRTNVGIKQDLTAHSDVNGRLSIALPPGFYDVLFSASAFSPKAKKIRILPGSVYKYVAQLEVDTGVAAALADRFK